MLWNFSKEKIFHRLQYVSPSQQQHAQQFLARIIYTFSDLQTRPSFVAELKKRLQLSAELFDRNFSSGFWETTPLPTTYFSYQNQSANGFLYSKTLLLQYKVSLKDQENEAVELQIACAYDSVFKKALNQSFKDGRLRMDLGEKLLIKQAPELLPDFYTLISGNVNELQKKAARMAEQLPHGMSAISSVIRRLQTETPGKPVARKTGIQIHPKYLKK
jgi:hypothetical protein